MATEVFIPRNFQAPALRMVEQANAIIEGYQAQGFTLTLRQIHYQFVARALYENTPKNYKLLGDILRKARDAGLSDWDAVEDRSRKLVQPDAWSSPAAIVRAAARSYQEDLWAGQDHRVEVWVEKDAQFGIIEDVCNEHRVAHTAHRGNSGQHLIYKAGKRFADYVADGLTPIMIHLADLDPKGDDMTRDCQVRLSRYARHPIEVRRIALNMDQVRRYRPPPNFVKLKENGDYSDSTTAKYVEKYGTNECWEMDALAPDVLNDLIRREITSLIDQKAWAKAERKEEKAKRQLMALAKEWGAR